MDPFRLDGRTVIVTGGNGGIGQGIVKVLSERGANIVIADRAAAVRPPTANGSGDILDVRTDITRRASVNALVRKTLKRFGRIDALINNAGAGKGVARMLDIGREDIDWLVNLNIHGTLNCIQPIAAVMREQGRGSIVNIASVAGVSGFAGRYDPVYAGCKGFIVSLTKALAVDLGEWNIRVNTIAPGWIVPESGDAISEGSFWNTMKDRFGTPEEFNAEYQRTGKLHASNGMSLQQLGRPTDIAHAAVYFASDAARHATGQFLSICGGVYMPS